MFMHGADMKFYRVEKNGETVGYAKTNTPSTEEGFIELTEAEYESAMAEIKAMVEAEAEAIEKDKDERIAELEKENASLLFQLLTGEEYTDV